MRLIKVHESLADGENSARLSLNSHQVIIIIKTTFHYGCTKRIVHKRGRSVDFYGSCKIRERRKQGRRFNEKVTADLSIKC